MATELSIELSFKRWCKRVGLVGCKLKLTAGRGWPDKAVLLPDNRVVWIEFKGPEGRLSAQQEFCIRKMQKAGHQVFVCRSLEEAQDAVAQLSGISSELRTQQAPL